MRIKLFERWMVRWIMAVVCLGFSGATFADWNVREDGMILHNGEPVFLVGLYQINSPADVAVIAKAGFNWGTAKYTLGSDITRLDKIIDAAERHHIFIQVSVSSEDVVAARLTARYRDRAGVISFDAEDDADDEKYRSFAQVRAKAQAIRRTAPGKLAYLSLTAWSPKRRAEGRKWLSIVDLAGVQSYPITPIPGYSYQKGAAGPLEENFDRLCHYMNLLPPHCAFIPNLQAFSWADNGRRDARYPTPRELRNFTYTALITGARGILYYRLPNLREQKALWAELKMIVRELKRLHGPMLTTGKRTMVDTGERFIKAAIWTGKKGDYLVVINVHETEKKKVSFKLDHSSAGHGRLIPVFLNRPKGLWLRNGKIVGSLKAGDVHVYKVLN
ncbi:MAG: hypothetical protein D6820_07650 [Lentisphaerae bacterium]|nr:MAG: hypothetical protein D6820_07650 [Lentisphaerota bacterium]